MRNEKRKRLKKRIAVIAEALEGRMLLSSSPTAHLVADVNQTLNDPQVWNLTTFGSKVAFTASNGVDGEELWISDGTSAGTVEVKDIDPGRSDSGAYNLTPVGNRLFFTASDGATNINGLPLPELWVSDGTNGGTNLLKAFDPATAGVATVSHLTSFAGSLYFTASLSGVTRLWRSDGTSAGTVQVENFTVDGVTSASTFYATSSRLYFVATTATSGAELWSTDGITTSLVKDINPGTASANIMTMASIGDVVLFSASTPTLGSELWRSDGTLQGTSEIGPINQTTGNGFFTDYTSFGAGSNGTTLIGGNDGLWVSDERRRHWLSRMSSITMWLDRRYWLKHQSSR